MNTLAQEQQLQQDLQNELAVSNQLLKLISLELQKIKTITMPDGDLAVNILQNASLIENLAKIQQINLENLPALNRMNIDFSDNIRQNMSNQEPQ